MDETVIPDAVQRSGVTVFWKGSHLTISEVSARGLFWVYSGGLGRLGPSVE